MNVHYTAIVHLQGKKILSSAWTNQTKLKVATFWEMIMDYSVKERLQRNLIKQFFAAGHSWFEELFIFSECRVFSQAYLEAWVWVELL